MIEPTEKNVLLKCEKCKYQEFVPLWVIEELNEFDALYGVKDEIRMQCPRCGRNMYPKDV